MTSPRILFVFCTLAALTTQAAEDAERDFALKVLPVFKEKCLSCHGDKPKEIKGDFDMRSREAMLKGGKSGEPDLVPGKPGESQLMSAIRRQDKDLSMPPKDNDKLTIAQIRLLEKWISDGAVWPDEKKIAALTKSSASSWDTADGTMMKTSGGLSPEWTNRRYKPENLWEYQPIKKPTVPNGVNPIDALLAVKMKALGITPAPLADRRTLIRRVTYDLTGLPPTPEEIDAFLKDSRSDDEAFSAVVERLLASPHYGEEWGRHWLDVVRYADTSGFANDYTRGNAWRYRDYVVRAFNEDKPYNQFVIEQIAGDELAAEESGNQSAIRNPQSELLIAPGFLRMGPWELTAMEVAKIARQRFLDDVTQSVGETFLGQALQCCRCHDHKFDPIPTRDYYSFQACFATTQLVERTAPFLPKENTSGFVERQDLDKARLRHIEMLKALDAKSLAAADTWFRDKKLDRTRWDAAVQKARSGEGKGKKRKQFVGAFESARTQLMNQNVPEDQFPPKQLGFTPEDFGHERIANKGLERLQWDFDRYEPVAFSVYSGLTPDRKAVVAPQRMPMNPMKDGELEQESILAGGDPFSPTQKVDPGVLSAVTMLQNAPVKVPGSVSGRRLALARWIASPDNPLTARVMVNRIWEWNFGQPIAGNPNNLGTTGKKPTQPELLDWLAATFIEKGWSVKALQRLILSSAAYRRSCAPLAEKDPDGVSYAAFQPRRLTAEELRDSMLSASGELNPAIGGIPVRPEMNVEAALQPRQVMGTFAEAWQPSPTPEQRHRRSLYALKIRGLRDPFMDVFNEPNPDLSCERRDASTVSPQVFSLFNSQASFTRALAFAARLMKEPYRDHAEIMQRAFLLTMGRAPSTEESAACLKHWDAMTMRHRSITFAKVVQPKEVTREAAEENTGQKFTFTETLLGADHFVPDISPADLDAETRGLAEVCLVLFNSNEFAYLY